LRGRRKVAARRPDPCRSRRHAARRVQIPFLEHELNDGLRDLEAACPPVAACPPGIDPGVDSGPGSGASPWQLWEISTPQAGPR
jgi:hypothetical protein